MANAPKKIIPAKAAAPAAPAPFAAIPAATAPELFEAKTEAAFAAPVEAIAEPMLKAAEASVAAGNQALQQATAQVTAQVNSAQENLRKATEQGVAQGKAAYERVKTAAEQANGSLETSFQTATKGIAQMQAKAFDAMRANSELMFDFVKALSGAKTMAEAVSLQTELARKQYDNLTAQNKELATLAQKAATDAMEPLKAGFGKALNAGR